MITQDRLKELIEEEESAIKRLKDRGWKDIGNEHLQILKLALGAKILEGACEHALFREDYWDLSTQNKHIRSTVHDALEQFRKATE